MFEESFPPSSPESVAVLLDRLKAGKALNEEIWQIAREAAFVEERYASDLAKLQKKLLSINYDLLGPLGTLWKQYSKELEKCSETHANLSSMLIDSVEHPMKRAFIQDRDWASLPSTENSIRKSTKDLDSKKKAYEKSKAKAEQKGKHDKNLAELKAAYETKRLEIAAETMGNVKQFEEMDRRRIAATKESLLMLSSLQSKARGSVAARFDQLHSKVDKTTAEEDMDAFCVRKGSIQSGPPPLAEIPRPTNVTPDVSMSSIPPTVMKSVEKLENSPAQSSSVDAEGYSIVPKGGRSQIESSRSDPFKDDSVGQNDDDDASSISRLSSIKVSVKSEKDSLTESNEHLLARASSLQKPKPPPNKKKLFELEGTKKFVAERAESIRSVSTSDKIHKGSVADSKDTPEISQAAEKHEVSYKEIESAHHLMHSGGRNSPTSSLMTREEVIVVEETTVLALGESSRGQNVPLRSTTPETPLDLQPPRPKLSFVLHLTETLNIALIAGQIQKVFVVGELGVELVGELRDWKSLKDYLALKVQSSVAKVDQIIANNQFAAINEKGSLLSLGYGIFSNEARKHVAAKYQLLVPSEHYARNTPLILNSAWAPTESGSEFILEYRVTSSQSLRDVGFLLTFSEPSLVMTSLEPASAKWNSESKKVLNKVGFLKQGSTGVVRVLFSNSVITNPQCQIDIKFTWPGHTTMEFVPTALPTADLDCTVNRKTLSGLYRAAN